MSETIRSEAASALAAVEEVTRAVLPEPAAAVVALGDATPPQAAEIRRRMAELDLGDEARFWPSDEALVRWRSLAHGGAQIVYE